MSAAAIDREIRLGYTTRTPMQIAVDIEAGAKSLAKIAHDWSAILPRKSSVGLAQGQVACLQRHLIDLRIALDAIAKE